LSEQIGPQELRRLFHDAIRERADAAVVSAGGFFLAHRQLIVELAAANRLPAMYAFREIIEAGGLASYGPDLGEAAERLARQVDQVLKGAKPGDVPVHQASKFELVLNITTARAVGLTIPPRSSPAPTRWSNEQLCWLKRAWGCQLAPSRSMAFSVVIILRMTATRMTLGFLPAAARRLWNVLRRGCNGAFGSRLAALAS
jgi:hypothetical protein